MCDGCSSTPRPHQRINIQFLLRPSLKCIAASCESAFPPDASERDELDETLQQTRGEEVLKGGWGGAIPCLSATTTTTAATHSSLHS